MDTSEVKNSKHAASTDEFWKEIQEKFQPEFYDEPVFVLSPKQSRLLKMAYMKVPKFGYLLEKMRYGQELYPIDKKLFEENIFEWEAMGFINHETALEEEYKLQLKRPSFLPHLPQWDEHISQLKGIIKGRELSPSFAKLWTAYIRRTQLINYLNVFEPYKAAYRTAQENESSEVEKYIFSLWYKYHQAKSSKKLSKTKSATDLAVKLYDITESKNGPKPSWPYNFYYALLNSQDQKYPLTRTVTDMNFSELNEYAEDGAFSLQDFPELFSVT